MVEAVGHADGGLDPVVGRLEPGVGVSQLDRAQDVGLYFVKSVFRV